MRLLLWHICYCVIHNQNSFEINFKQSVRVHSNKCLVKIMLHKRYYKIMLHERYKAVVNFIYTIMCRSIGNVLQSVEKHVLPLLIAIFEHFVQLYWICDDVGIQNVMIMSVFNSAHANAMQLLYLLISWPVYLDKSVKSYNLCWEWKRR